jgi:predicted amidohydrolase
LAANAAKILEYAQRADRLGAAVTVFPELMLTGIGPDDPAAGDDLRRGADQALTRLAQVLDHRGLGGRHVVVGTTGTGRQDRATNAAVVLHKGKVALATTAAGPLSGPLSGAVFAAHGHRFAVAVGQARNPEAAGAVDAILVLADGLAYAADPSGRLIAQPAAGHEGLMLWTAGAPAEQVIEGRA